jgi:hypothetical protein
LGGHGAAWQILIAAVQKKANEVLVDWNFRLYGERSMEIHLRLTGRLLDPQTVAMCWPGKKLKLSIGRNGAAKVELVDDPNWALGGRIERYAGTVPGGMALQCDEPA